MTAKTLMQILAPVGGRFGFSGQPLQASGDRLDRRQRVVELMPEHPDQALPGLALFLAQRTAHVGEDEQPAR